MSIHHTDPTLSVPENDNGDEDTLLCDMSWVQIREMEDVYRLCLDVMKRMQEHKKCTP